MERDFLYFILYMAFVELREKSHEEGDVRTYRIADILHNVPLNLRSDQDPKEIVNDLRNKAIAKGGQKWFDTKMEQFLERYPQYSS